MSLMASDGGLLAGCAAIGVPGPAGSEWPGVWLVRFQKEFPLLSIVKYMAAGLRRSGRMRGSLAAGGVARGALVAGSFGLSGGLWGGLLGGVSLVMVGCDKPAAATSSREETPIVELVATTPSMTTLPRIVRTTGTLYGDEEATIAAKVSGRIVAIYADLGDRVAPSEPLLQIDPMDYELALAERANALAETLSRLGLRGLEDGQPPTDFAIDKVPAVARAMLEAGNARVRFERARDLAERPQPLMGPQEYSDIRTAWEVAQSDVDVERLLAQTVLAAARTIESQVRIAAQRVADTTPLAPLAAEAGGTDYEIAQRMVSVGDFVQIGTPLMRLVDSDPIKLRVNVPERRASEIRIGQRVSVGAGGGSGVGGGVGGVTRGVLHEGRIARVSPALDISTRTLGVEVHIPNPEGALRPGSFTSAEIMVGEDEAMVVPVSSILTFAGVHKVIAIVDGSAVERRVELGTRGDGVVQILSGLEGNETIALRPPGSMTTGVRIRIVDEAADGGSGEAGGEGSRRGEGGAVGVGRTAAGSPK